MNVMKKAPDPWLWSVSIHAHVCPGRLQGFPLSPLKGDIAGTTAPMKLGPKISENTTGMKEARVGWGRCCRTSVVISKEFGV